MSMGAQLRDGRAVKAPATTATGVLHPSGLHLPTAVGSRISVSKLPFLLSVTLTLELPSEVRQYCRDERGVPWAGAS